MDRRSQARVGFFSDLSFSGRLSAQHLRLETLVWLTGSPPAVSWSTTDSRFRLGSSPKRVGNFVLFFQLEIYIRGFSEA